MENSEFSCDTGEHGLINKIFSSFIFITKSTENVLKDWDFRKVNKGAVNSYHVITK